VLWNRGATGLVVAGGTYVARRARMAHSSPAQQRVLAAGSRAQTMALFRNAKCLRARELAAVPGTNLQVSAGADDSPLRNCPSQH
jgi:hypothetical protein